MLATVVNRLVSKVVVAGQVSKNDLHLSLGGGSKAGAYVALRVVFLFPKNRLVSL